MNKVVKYDNYMNSLKFTGFTITDFNFLMVLCSRMRDKDINKETFSFSELRSITNYKKSNSIKQFVSDIEKMNEKLMRVSCKLKTETKIIMFVLFPTFEIDLEEQILTVAVNEKFKFILNELVKNFTRFDLKEFISLESKYSKTLYRLLKQYKTTGIFEINLEKFREKMDCPESYSTKYIMDKIIKPSLEELRKKDYFQNLVCTVQYAHKRGRPVMGYLFTFKPEERIQYIDKQQESEQQKKPITRQSKPKEKKRAINKFCDFQQHNYSAEDMKIIEQATLRNAESILKEKYNLREEFRNKE